MKNTLTRVTPGGNPGPDHRDRRWPGPDGCLTVNTWLTGAMVADWGQAQRASQGRASRTADSNITACTNAWGRLPRS